MNNTMNYNDKNFQATTVAVMNDILASDATGSTMDDLYKTVCKYVKMTRKQFEDLYKESKAKLQAWKDNGSLEGKNCELNEEDLDMVVGGSVGSFFSAIGQGLKTAACAVGNFVKENAASIGIIVAIGVGLACFGAMVGVMAVGAAVEMAGLSTATATAVCVGGGAILGGAAGIGIGIYNQYAD